MQLLFVFACSLRDRRGDGRGGRRWWLARLAHDQRVRGVCGAVWGRIGGLWRGHFLLRGLGRRRLAALLMWQLYLMPLALAGHIQWIHQLLTTDATGNQSLGRSCDRARVMRSGLHSGSSPQWQTTWGLLLLLLLLSLVRHQINLQNIQSKLEMY